MQFFFWLTTDKSNRAKKFLFRYIFWKFKKTFLCVFGQSLDSKSYTICIYLVTYESFIFQGSCGVKYNQRTEERKVAIAVRAHPTIELLEDRLYVVTCGRAGFQNSRNEVSVVQLKVTLPSDPTRKIDTVLEGKRYKLRAEVLEHDRKQFIF